MIHFVFQCGVAFVATVCFAGLFHAPTSEYLFAGVTGAIGWAVYLICMSLGTTVVMASFFGAVALSITARVLAVVRACPATVFLFTGIFPLVPGIGIYYTTYYLIANETALGSAKGFETFKVAMAIAVGITLAFSVPYGFMEKIIKRFMRA